MSDILETVEKLRKIGPIGDGRAAIALDGNIPLAEDAIQLHIEAQTYLLAEILKLLRTNT